MKTPINKQSNQSSDSVLNTSPLRRVTGREHCSDPRLVTRGESLYTPLLSTPADSAITDWLNCTFLMPNTPEAMKPFFSMIRDILGDKFARIIDRKRGHIGWKQSFDIGESSAIFAIGGQRGTGFLQLPGQACTLISKTNWLELVWFLDQVMNAKITRWDGAVDDYQGTHSVDWAVEQYQAGQFSTGGNKASCTQFGNWLEPDGRGRTFVVGRRKNGKMIRIYEKGKQLGNPNSPWVRWELELHSRDRLIPWDVIANPGPYVAGAYATTHWICKEASRIKTFQQTTKISYDALVQHAKNAYGPLINIMNAIEGSPEQVISKLIGKGKPKRLKTPVPPELVDQQNANKKAK